MVARYSQFSAEERDGIRSKLNGGQNGKGWAVGRELRRSRGAAAVRSRVATSWSPPAPPIRRGGAVRGGQCPARP